MKRQTTREKKNIYMNLTLGVHEFINRFIKEMEKVIDKLGYFMDLLTDLLRK